MYCDCTEDESPIYFYSLGRCLRLLTNRRNLDIRIDHQLRGTRNNIFSRTPSSTVLDIARVPSSMRTKKGFQSVSRAGGVAWSLFGKV